MLHIFTTNPIHFDPIHTFFEAKYIYVNHSVNNRCEECESFLFCEYFAGFKLFGDHR